MSKYEKYLTYLKEVQEERTTNDQHRNSRVLIVDSLNTFIRAYSASPATNTNGDHVGGISGFLLSIGHAIKAINPTRLVLVFDGKDGSARRKSLFPEYKAKRKVKIRLNRSEEVDKEDNQLYQLIRLMDYLAILPLTIITIDRTEADDVIAYLANDYLLAKDSQVFIMSSDKDFMQLIDNRVHVWSPTKKKMFFTEDVVEDFQIIPRNFALYRSLIGDSSDCIPGVNGVGAATLIERFPKIATDEMNVDAFFVYAKELAEANPKVKIYKKVVEAEKAVRLYFDVIQLKESNINASSKINIMDLMDRPIQPLAKMKFHTMLIEDGMTQTIKNVDMWLREITTKLDKHLIED
jgi:DNA polymerase I